VLVPVAVTFSSFARVEGDILAHLIEFALPELVGNTCGWCSAWASASACWACRWPGSPAMCEFPGRRLFDWALMLPLALPAYVTAFVAIGLLDFTGPLQTWLREGWGITGLPEIRSRGGVILVMSLALYPYVYLIAKNAFRTQGAIALEAAQSLGLSRWQGFFRVALPMARPWIAAGLMLALMETLADFGTMAIFNYDTFTTAIYKAWYSLFSLAAAAQLASILILFVLVVVVFEQRSRTQMRYGAVGRSAAQRRIKLSPALAGLAFCTPERCWRSPSSSRSGNCPVDARRHRRRPRRPLLGLCLAFGAAGRHRRADGGGGGAAAGLCRAPAPRRPR
jgi:iron(III) transport system permease protein